MKKIIVLFLTLVSASFFANFAVAKEVKLLNVSYDPTREFYDQYNRLFANYWIKKTGDKVVINQSHGGSGKQARSVLDGLKADVVTLALASDIDILTSKNLLPKNWQAKLANNSSPYTSTIVFLVKKGNPKNVKDWSDLSRKGLVVITPNPKTSGGARWNYLAAYGYGLRKFGSEEKAQNFVKKIFKNVPILDTGARGSTVTFAERNIGDVLVTWENEAFSVMEKLGKDRFEIVTPSLSILTEPPVAVVEKNAVKNGTLEVAQNYLQYLYSEPAQDLIAKHGFRPTNAVITKKYAKKFAKVEMLTIKDFGGWNVANKKHFDDGGTFDRIYLRQ